MVKITLGYAPLKYDGYSDRAKWLSDTTHATASMAKCVELISESFKPS